MPKDYARYVNNQPKRPLAKHGWRNRLSLAVFLIFLLVSAGYVVHVYKQRKVEFAQQGMTSWVKQLKTWFINPLKEQDRDLLFVDQNPAEEAKQDADIQFSFYTNLPTMQVPALQSPAPTTTVLVEDTSGTTPIKKPEEKYLLQMAAFRNPAAAGEMRISLLLAGFEVEIVKAMNNNQQIYQLQQGPFANIVQARSMQRELKKKGIESVIVKKVA